jgi:hypothetical protein
MDFTIRSSPIEFPEANEILAMLEKESSKKANFENFSLIKFSFKAFDNLLINYGLVVADLLVLSDLNYFYTLTNKVKNIIKEVILRGEISKDVLEDIYNYLCEEDEILLENVTTLFVFGSAQTIRSEKALELFNLKPSLEIIVSGKGPHYGVNEISEAENMKLFLTNNGIPENKIFVENKSISIPDNVKRTLELYSEKTKKMIIITSPFAMRRAYIDWMKFYNTIGYRPTRVCSKVSEKFSREHWFESQEGVDIVINECFKILLERVIDNYLKLN